MYIKKPYSKRFIESCEDSGSLALKQIKDKKRGKRDKNRNLIVLVIIERARVTLVISSQPHTTKSM